MHCSTNRPTTETDDDVSWWHDERFRTADPQRLLEHLADGGLLDGEGPPLLLLRGSGSEQQLAGWCELRPDLSAPEEAHLRGDGSPYDQVRAGLWHAGLRQEDRWAPFGPERARAALVIRGRGRVVFGPEEYDWLDGLKYGTNHSGTGFSDCYLVTEHGWDAFLGGRYGEHGSTPARRPAGSVGGDVQSGLL